LTRNRLNFDVDFDSKLSLSIRGAALPLADDVGSQMDIDKLGIEEF